MEIVVGFVIGLVLCAVISSVAARRFHRSSVGWFFISILFSPLIAILLLFLVGEKPLRLSPAQMVQPQRRIEPTF